MRFETKNMRPTRCGRQSGTPKVATRVLVVFDSRSTPEVEYSEQRPSRADWIRELM